jgi:STE24 endopeptidase
LAVASRIGDVGQSSSEREPSQEQRQEAYTRSMRRTSLFLVLLGVCWIPEMELSQSPIVAVATSLLVASVMIFSLSYSQFRIDSKYKQVTATTKDYFVANIYLYLIALLPAFVLLGVLYVLPRIGILTVVYADGLLLGVVLFLARFPLSLRLGHKAAPVTDAALLSSFSGLAVRMGVPRVDLYSIDWRRFKAANAFQAGPRRFTVFVSNYLLDNMSSEEVSAVMAHELAHAKKRHVLKLTVLVLCIAMVGSDFFIVGDTLNQGSPLPWVLVAAGFAVVFAGSRLTLGLQRRFELEADETAVRTLGDGRPMIGALRRLMNLNLLPAEGRSGTHPSVAKRVERIEQLMVGQQSEATAS